MDVTQPTSSTTKKTTTLEVITSFEEEEQDQNQILRSPPESGNTSNDSIVILSTPPRDGGCSNDMYGDDNDDGLGMTCDGDDYIDDIGNYIQSDDEVIQPFLNDHEGVEDEEDTDISRTEFLDFDDFGIMNQRLQPDTSDYPYQQEQQQQRYDNSSATTLSVNMSSTTGSTIGGTTVGRSNIHPRHSDVLQYDDTTTSYNTDDGYADDENDTKIRAILGGGGEEEEDGTQRQQRNQQRNRSSVSPILQHQRSMTPPSPSHRQQIHHSRSASASPSMTQQPTSANLFRYLRTWGRHQESTVGSTEVGTNDHVNAELTSDEDDDDISMSQEETSWIEDDDDMSETSVDNDLYHDSIEQIHLDWRHIPMLPNRFCLPHQPMTDPSTIPDTTTTTTEAMKGMSSIVYNTPPSSSNVNSSKVVPIPYLDSSLMMDHSNKKMTYHDSMEFVYDHHTLLQALLQLLAERDQVGVEGSMDSTENIWKKGSLKKLSFSVGRRKHQRPAVAGAWKVKYVELRQGNICYYEDSEKTGRKTIHLRQADTIVQESSYRGPGYVFELLVQGSPTRYWMASSDEERQAWIKAIQLAAIGDDVPRKDLDLQPYEESLILYMSLREALQQAESQEAYVASIQSAMKEIASLQVPVQWVQEKIENDLSPILLGTLKPPKFGRSPQKLLKASISEFWKNMNQTTFSINGLLVRHNTPLASERIIGSLTRCILEYDKAFATSEERDYYGIEPSYISELQAISYARHILLTLLRSKDRQDTSFVVRYLLENPGVMISEQCTTDNNDVNPVNIEVTFAGEDLPDEFLHAEEISSWVWTRTRRKNQSSIAVPTGIRKQRHTFAVLSGTVLSYYAAASPRPHGLRGQLVLLSSSSVRYEGEEVVPENSGDNSTTMRGVRYVICIISENHQDRLLSFENQQDAMTWKDAIQLAIDTTNSGTSNNNPPRVVTTTSSTPAPPPTTLLVPTKMLKGAERVIKVAADGTIQGGIRVIRGAKDGGIRVIRGAKDGGIRVIRTATGSGFKVIRGAVGMLQRQQQQHKNSFDDNNDNSPNISPSKRRPSFQMLFNNTIVQQGKREPTVQCVFQTTQTFIIRDHSYSTHSDADFDHTTSDTSNTTPNGGPFGENNTDVGWMSVQAKLYQAFLMSGGSSGRIARGDALVELIFVETKVENDDDASC